MKKILLTLLFFPTIVFSYEKGDLGYICKEINSGFLGAKQTHSCPIRILEVSAELRVQAREKCYFFDLDKGDVIWVSRFSVYDDKCLK